MKKIITIAATALLLFVGSASADYFRVFYYVEGENISYDKRGNEHKDPPFKYTAEANTPGEAFDRLVEKEPRAIDVTINKLNQ
jgi:hypothetical protein